MLKAMPNLSHHFHLAPADIWGLTFQELDVYLDALDDLAREAG